MQIQILLLLRRLQQELRLSIIFGTHDVGVAVEIADRIAIMYAGRIVESGRVHDILRDLAALPPGCAFAPRCPQVQPACRVVIPPMFRPAAELRRYYEERDTLHREPAGIRVQQAVEVHRRIEHCRPASHAERPLLLGFAPRLPRIGSNPTVRLRSRERQASALTRRYSGDRRMRKMRT